MCFDDELNDIKERLIKLENKNKEAEFKLDDRAFTKDIITKSYRLHKDAVEEFNKTIRSNNLKGHSVQNLVSQALWEFSEKYKEY